MSHRDPSKYRRRSPIPDYALYTPVRVMVSVPWLAFQPLVPHPPQGTVHGSGYPAPTRPVFLG